MKSTVLSTFLRNILASYQGVICSSTFVRFVMMLQVSQDLVIVGRNKLAQIIPEMCKAAGIQGKKTGHSGKVTCATVPHFSDQLIKERTGHRSVESLHKYKHTGCPCLFFLLWLSGRKRTIQIQITTFSHSRSGQKVWMMSKPCFLSLLFHNVPLILTLQPSKSLLVLVSLVCSTSLYCTTPLSVATRC